MLRFHRLSSLLLSAGVTGVLAGCSSGSGTSSAEDTPGVRPGSAPDSILLVEAGGGRLDRWVTKQQENCDPGAVGEDGCLDIQTEPAVPEDRRISHLACRITSTDPPAEDRNGERHVPRGATVTVEVATDTTPEDPGDDRALCGLAGA
ncbi:hypothetical protein [Geodermatophilus sp. SYSU D01105]